MNKMSNKGITLVEVMTAILLFTLGIAALLGVITQSVQSAKKAGFAYKAYNLAKSHLDTLRSVSFSDLSSAVETSTAINEQGVPDADGEFIRNTTVSTSYTGDGALTYVKVSVNYVFQSHQSASPMEVSTVIFSNG